MRHPKHKGLEDNSRKRLISLDSCWHQCFYSAEGVTNKEKDAITGEKRKTGKTFSLPFPELSLRRPHAHLDVVLRDLDLSCVDIVDQFLQSLSVHFPDLHLMGLAFTHITCKHKRLHTRLEI